VTRTCIQRGLGANCCSGCMVGTTCSSGGGEVEKTRASGASDLVLEAVLPVLPAMGPDPWTRETPPLTAFTPVMLDPCCGRTSTSVRGLGQTSDSSSTSTINWSGWGMALAVGAISVAAGYGLAYVLKK
jgi:hypothetical protein